MPDRKIRVLIAKPGLDGHDRGAKTVASVIVIVIGVFFLKQGGGAEGWSRGARRGANSQ